MWLIIGYGNRLRGDDGAGPVLAEKLAERVHTDQARVLVVHQLTPELVLELLKPEIDQVLFIDAKRGSDKAFEMAPLSRQICGDSSYGHQLQPELLLYTAEQLYARSLPGWLLTVAGSDFTFSSQLSSATAAVMDSAVAHCLSFLGQSISHNNNPRPLRS